MSGTIRQRGRNSFELRWQAAGKTRTATVRGTKTEAKRELTRLLAETDQGVAPAVSARLTFSAWFDQWLEMARGEVRPVTADRYEAAVRLYLAPALGAIRLRDLSPRDIQAAFTKWAASGLHRGVGGLARSTLGLLRKILNAALQRALELELIGRNPMTALRKRLPTGAAPEAKVIGAEAIAALLSRAKGTPYRPAILLAAACGLRRGEACALKWRHVDLATKELRVEEARVPARRGIVTGKTKSGRSRTVRIPEFALDLLRQHRVAQAEQLLKLGIRLDGDTYVCAHTEGSPINPMSLSAWCRSNSPIGYHGLRHSHASLLLAGGTLIKVVSNRLGHANAALTFVDLCALAAGRGSGCRRADQRGTVRQQFVAVL
jgi:integrase